MAVRTTGFRAAYSAMALSAVFVWTGAAGYVLSLNDRFHTGTWAGEVIWPQVWVGLMLCPVAAGLWGRAVRLSRAVPARTLVAADPDLSAARGRERTSAGRHILIAFAVLAVMTGVAIWLRLGPVVHS